MHVEVHADPAHCLYWATGGLVKQLGQHPNPPPTPKAMHWDLAYLCCSQWDATSLET